MEETKTIFASSEGFVSCEVASLQLPTSAGLAALDRSESEMIAEWTCFDLMKQFNIDLILLRLVHGQIGIQIGSVRRIRWCRGSAMLRVLEA